MTRFVTCALLLATPGLAQASGPRLEAVTTSTLEGLTSAWTVADLEGDDRDELIAVGRDGRVLVLELDGDGRLAPRAGAPLRLPHPAHSVLALVDLLGTGRTDLVVLSSAGAHVHRIQPAGQFAAEPVVLTTTGRLGFRVGEPDFVDFAIDVNADGRLDLVVPRGQHYELWLRAAGEGEPRFEMSQTLPIDFDHSTRIESAHLSDEMRNRIRIPVLDITDLNGDGRPDLRVQEGDRRSFFVQDADGRFPEEAVTVDLSIFRDTTPEATVRIGETLVLSDKQQFQSGDLDGDGIPDHVIAHRRKVWSFLATPDGPQFTKASTRMVAEDVSGMLLIRLDDDAREDLLVFKVDVPTAGQLVLGIVSSIDVPITVLGYRTDEEGNFESHTTWRRELTLRAPSIVSLLGGAEDLVRRFTEVISKFRWSTIGDFDGDGNRDLTMIAEDGASADLWLRPKGGEDLDNATERWLRDLLFVNENTVFDVDRLLKLVAQVFDTRTSSLTGERPPDASGTLPAHDGRHIASLLSADLDGDGRDEVVTVLDTDAEPGRLSVSVLRWAETK